MEQDLQKLVHDVQFAFLKHIIEGLKNKTLSLEEGRKFAVDFLKIEPFTSPEDAEEKLKHFQETYPEYGFLYAFIKAYNKEKKMGPVIQKMKEHIQANEIDKALQIAQNS